MEKGNTHIAPMQNTIPATKAYKNAAFLNSQAARNIRILCEHQETETRLAENKMKATILVFGSARSKSTQEYERIKAKLLSEIETGDDREGASANLERLEQGKWMCEYFDKISELCQKITAWSMQSSLGTGRDLTGASRSKSFSEDMSNSTTDASSPSGGQSLVVTTGGGPGFMEAANRGAAAVEGSRTMGMGISLPFETGLNSHVSPELAFEFHYFFTRKFWMVYHCQALIAAPGGVGTFDELFEVLTLKQTGKVAKDLPVVLFGKEFWKTVVNWEALVQFGTVSRRDVDELFFTDDVDEAVKYITDRLTTIANFDMKGVTHSS